jgi:hypothetical protein
MDVLMCGVEGTEADGVMGGWCRSGSSEAEVMTDPFSEVVDGRRIMLGRLDEGNEGVRECRISIFLAREIG